MSHFGIFGFWLIFFIVISSNGINGAPRAELKDQTKNERFFSSIHDLLSEMTEKCYKECASEPKSQLSDSEKECIALCMDEHMETHG
ncbi:mitochondrial import inner membrane translocase subunit Tim13-like [Oculina patagonica]